MLLACFFELLTRWDRYQPLNHSLPLIWLISAITALGASITGFLLSQSGDYSGETLWQHQWIALFTTLSISVIYILKRAQKLGSQFLVPLSIFTLISLTGHLGGSLTHGSDYLTEYLPFKQLLGIEGRKFAPITDVQEARVYEDVIARIVSTKCEGCHGPNKQKGKLRLDNPEWILKAGKSGHPLIGITASESEMMKRINLELRDDDHMPPKEKPQLSSDEIDILSWWINHGAPFDKLVKDLEQEGTIKEKLSKLENAEAIPLENRANIPARLPEVALPEVDELVISRLVELGAVVLPAGHSSNFYEVNLVNVDSLTEELFSLLKTMGPNMVRLKMRDQPITDEHFKKLNLPHLVWLSLDGTRVTDITLGHLTNLKFLRSLNLVGTPISESGLNQLSELPSLEKVYTFRTKINYQNLDPKIPFDSGGYQVPYFPEDTVFIPMN